MRKLLLSFSFLAMTGLAAFAQNPTGVCQPFNSASPISTYPDPSTTISGTVASNELTITFNNTAFWGDEIKIALPSAVNVTSNLTVSYDIQVVSLTINGTGCSAINYLPLGISVYDSEGDYTNGNSTVGYYDNAYVAGSVAINNSASAVNYTSISGVSIKAASFSDGTCTAPTSVSGSIKIKNLRVGDASASCVGTAVEASKAISASRLYPNPTSDLAKVELTLQSASAVKVVLSDAMGKPVMTVAEGSFAELTKEFSVANLNKGIYTVNYYINGEAAKAELLMVK